MIKKLQIIFLCAISTYGLTAIAHNEQEFSEIEKPLNFTKAVKVDKFKEEMRTKIEELEEVNTVLAGQVQNLVEAEIKRDSSIINLRDVLVSISSYRSQSVAEIKELHERCKSLELRLDKQNKNAKKWALAGCLATVAAFLVYEAWLYKTKMGKKTK